MSPSLFILLLLFLSFSHSLFVNDPLPLSDLSNPDNDVLVEFPEPQSNTNNKYTKELSSAEISKMEAQSKKLEAEADREYNEADNLHTNEHPPDDWGGQAAQVDGRFS